MKRREGVLALGTAAVIVLALLTVFALELSNTQAKSKQDVRARVHERAVLAAALIDSLFQSVEQQVPQDARKYGARTVAARSLNAASSQNQNSYLAVLDASDRVLAASRGLTAQARAGLAGSAALALIRGGRPYGLGNVLPYGKTGVINFAVVFPTRFGPRILLSGFTPSALSRFISGELRKIPGVKGAHNYLIDGHNTVIASTNPAIPAGHVFKPAGTAPAGLSGEARGHYYDQVALTNSTWRVVLAAPDGPLFASVSGPRKWVPWIIFVAFALVALSALALGRRALRSAGLVREANARLESVNDQLATTNATLERRAGARALERGARAVRVDRLARPPGAAAQGAHVHPAAGDDRGRAPV